jgi:hypothetical protein
MLERARPPLSLRVNCMDGHSFDVSVAAGSAMAVVKLKVAAELEIGEHGWKFCHLFAAGGEDPLADDAKAEEGMVLFALYELNVAAWNRRLFDACMRLNGDMIETALASGGDPSYEKEDYAFRPCLTQVCMARVSSVQQSRAGAQPVQLRCAELYSIGG